MKVPQVWIWGLQINFSEWVNSQIRNPQITRIECNCFIKSTGLGGICLHKFRCLIPIDTFKIEVYLMYNSVLVSGAHKSDSGFFFLSFFKLYSVIDLGGASGKEPACQCRRHKKHNGSLDWEDPLEEGMATHSSILAWRVPCTEEPGGLRSIGLIETT